MSIETLKTALKGMKLPKADWIGIREVSETTTLRQARDGQPETNTTEISHGAMVEVLANGQFGYSATTRLDPESLHAAADRAAAQALSASAHSVFKFTVQERPAVRKQYSTPTARPFAEKTPGQINDLLIRICDKLKRSPKIVRASAHAQLVEMESHYVSTAGSEATQRFSMIATGFGATAQDGNAVQRRTDAGHHARSHQGGWEFFDTPDLWMRVEKVSEEALELLSAPDCPNETLPLVIMPDQMMLQIHESIGHPLELDRIMGDERNYAGWSFVKPADFGTLQYGSPVMNVTFDPSRAGEFASYAFDDSGFEAKREYLIQGGKLVRGLGGLESQARSKIPGVANARASSWNRAPIDRMANLNLEPGTSSFDDIVSSLERGVLMYSNRSWSIDDFRNKFQFGCEYAKLIENGKIKHTLRNPNYRGVTVPFWTSLKMVGNANTSETYGTPYCGKGEPNQIIRVGHASPVCLFDGVEVFGGAS